VSDFVLDASPAVRWFLEDEADREYSLAVLRSLSGKRALVPVLWFYEVGSALVMAQRRKRISADQIDGFLARLRLLPLDIAPHTSSDILELPAFAIAQGLTNYDAAYLSLAVQRDLPLATTDGALRQASDSMGVPIYRA
jgi:predicted nucleic acid-binding protein